MLLADADQRRLRRRRGGRHEQQRQQPARRRTTRRRLTAQQDGVLVRSTRARSSRAGRAARRPAFQSLCLTPGAITTVSPARTSASSSPRRMRPGAGGEVVDLLGDAVVVLERLAARRDRRFGQRLVDRVAGRDLCELADGRAVGGDERLAMFKAVVISTGGPRLPSVANHPRGQMTARRAVRRLQTPGQVGLWMNAVARTQRRDWWAVRVVGGLTARATGSAGALCGDDVTQDGLIQGVHLGGLHAEVETVAARALYNKTLEDPRLFKGGRERQIGVPATDEPGVPDVSRKETARNAPGQGTGPHCLREFA